MRLGLAYFLRTRDIDAFRRHAGEMVENGANYVVLVATDFDQLFFPATVAGMVEAAHRAGLEVYLDPWGLGGIFCTPYSVFPIHHPEACQVLSDGLALARACPSSDEWRAHLAGWVQFAARTGADGVFWDEPQFFHEADPKTGAVRWGCRCARCQARYRAEVGHPMPVELTEPVVAFRRRQALDVLREACDAAHATGLRNMVCLLPFDDSLTAGRSSPADLMRAARAFADWDEVASIKSLDSLGTDPYPGLMAAAMDKGAGPTAPDAAWRAEPASYMRRPVEHLLEVCRRHGRQPHVWVQAFDVPAGVEPMIVEAARWLRATGLSDIAFWADRWGTGDNRLSQRPAEVWQAVVDALGLLGAGSGGD
ncbi:MAG: hypothetical protein AB1609_10490 [Bacillota bacterium]